MLDFLYAIILGMVQGLTEFLPISSTGHLIVVAAILGFPTVSAAGSDPKALRTTFEIFIQVGSVLAVIAYYFRDLLKQVRTVPTDRTVQRFWLYIVVASIPGGLAGLLFHDFITGVLYSPIFVGIGLVVGGVLFLWIESTPREAETHQPENVSLKQAVLMGLAQMAALFPGISRSGASIMSGMLVGLDRATAAAFSFYMAIPLLGSATGYQLFKELRSGHVVASQLPLLAVGAVAAFIFSWIAITWLLRYISTHDFRRFGVYRIVVGIIIIVLTLFTTILSH
jgi:undecaprenyl-diphosphatase